MLAHIEPEVLIVDEALAVGDSEFQKKCRQTMHELLEAGTTMFLVSHDMAMVQELCQRAIWIHGGRVMENGPCEDVVQQYYFRLHDLLEADARGEAQEAESEATTEADS